MLDVTCIWEKDKVHIKFYQACRFHAPFTDCVIVALVIVAFKITRSVQTIGRTQMSSTQEQKAASVQIHVQRTNLKVITLIPGRSVVQTGQSLLFQDPPRASMQHYIEHRTMLVSNCTVHVAFA